MVNELIELNKRELYNLEQLKNIKDNPVVIATIFSVIKSVPIIGDLIDSSIEYTLTEFQQKKRDQLLEIILSSDIHITSEAVNDVEFIVNFAKTLGVVNKLATNDKVKYFANLLKNTYFMNNSINADTYDEYLNILEDISFREIQYLCYLYNYSKDKNIKRWGSFKESFSKNFSIDKKLIYPIYYRLKRTGFVDEVLGFSPGTISGDEEAGYEMESGDIDTDYFYITKAFEKFREVVIEI